MYSLIIADDEEIERKAFSLLINQNFPQITYIDEAANGIEFIDKVLEIKPDIAIVDINMPGLNGLEAIKALRQKGITSKFIINTAYNYFEYAKEALSLGAEDYILKPMKREKIIAAIDNCVAGIINERKKENEHNRLKKLVDDLLPIIETDFMSSILLDDINSENLRIYMDILGIDFKSGFIMTFYIPDEGISLIKSDYVEKNALKKEVLNLVKTEIKSICNCIVGSLISNKISIFVPMENELSQYSCKLWSIDLAQLILGKVETAFGLKTSVGIGKLYDSIVQLSQSYKESINVLLDKTVNSNVKHVGDLFSETSVVNPFVVHENEILKQVLSCNYEECVRTVDKIFSEMVQEHKSDNVKDVMLGFVALLKKMLTENNTFISIDKYSFRTAFDEIMGANGKNELLNWLKIFLKNIIEEIGNEKRNKVGNFVKLGANYINEHFNKEISLEKVAENIGISPYYLSRLFKQELRKNFIDYLTEVRVKQAVNLLMEKDYSVKELSLCVGYVNPTYFCKVFKKITGKTIGEYKNSLSTA